MSLKPADPAQPCVIRQWNEDGYMWYVGGSCMSTWKREAKRFASPLEAWETVAALRQAGYGQRDDGPSPNLSVHPA